MREGQSTIWLNDLPIALAGDAARDTANGGPEDMTDHADFDENSAPVRRMPILTVLGCSGLLLLLAVLAPHVSESRPLPLLLLAGATLGVLFWLAAFVLTIRRASLAWKLGSLVLLIAIGVGGGAGAWLLYKVQARSDATSFAELDFAPDGTPTFPRGAVARGPMSRMFAEAVTADAEDRRAQDAEIAKFGLAALTSPYLLEQAPGILANCDAVAALKASAHTRHQRHEARIAEVAAAIDRADMTASLRQALRSMIGADTLGQPDPVQAQQDELLEATAGLCQLLARRTWFNDNAYFGFRDPADQAAFRALNKRREAAASETAKLEKASRESRLAARTKVQDELTLRVLETL